MRVLIDLEKCLAYGNCEASAPEVFEVDPLQEKTTIHSEPVDEAGWQSVREAVRDCPTGALSIIEEEESYG